ncbi:sensor histidine kinase [Bailinhaonella thermotolerans]|uniref:Sensor histidine kinase n=1 Tax=Bailinhaonella thermotolerans TaxID=1070861 RepID=A0A3A4B4Q2_9ACTN|nr:sensor histidine kinase [Bailinhaonella thermotolerans]RJL32422.1 sensor histidine kinase [Bailinhaonella thermotolerans]
MSASFSHQLLLYGSDAGFLASAEPFLRAALAAGEPAMLLARPHTIELVRDALGDDAKNLDTRESADWFLHPPRTLAASHDYVVAQAGRRTWVLGEPLWVGRDAREVGEWHRYEAAMNLAMDGMNAAFMCAYDRRVTAPEIVAAATVTHPECAFGPEAKPNPEYVLPERLNGDDGPLPEPPADAFRMRFTLTELKRLRDVVGEYAARAELSRNRIPSFVLSVAEIANNAVEHGAGYGIAHLWTQNDVLACEIVEPSTHFDVLYPGYIPPPPDSPRGYGLWITRQLCDLVDVRTGGGKSRIRLQMRIP